MTKEEKELLLKSLCETAQYGVKGLALGRETDTIKTICLSEYPFIVTNGGWPCHVGEQFKPYLRSMDSMTEDEKAELNKRYVWTIIGNTIHIRYHSEGYWDTETECPAEEYLWLFDWLNKHHFDYRGLIPMGIALEAPEGMYE